MLLQNSSTSVAASAPPVAVSVLTIFGVPLGNFVMLTTLVYTCLLIYVLVRDKIWRQKNRRAEDRMEDDPLNDIPDDNQDSNLS